MVTPIKEEITTDLSISGIISSPLSEMDIKFLQTAKFTNSTHLKISRSEKDILVKAKLISPFEKYSFTKEQIEKIANLTIKFYDQITIMYYKISNDVFFQ